MNKYKTLHITALDDGFFVEEIGDDCKKYAIGSVVDMIAKVREVFMNSNNDADCDMHVQRDLKRKTLAESIWTEPHKLCQDICPATNAKQDRARHLLTERIEPVHSDEFVFQECEPESFSWQNLSEKRFGKTIVLQAGNVLRITREGYGVVVFADLESLKRLKVLLSMGSKYFNRAVSMISYNKRTVLRTCLNEVDLAKLDGVDCDCDGCNKKAEADEPEPEMSERTKRLWKIAKEKQDKWLAEKENAVRAEK